MLERLNIGMQNKCRMIEGIDAAHSEPSAGHYLHHVGFDVRHGFGSGDEHGFAQFISYLRQVVGDPFSRGTCAVYEQGPSDTHELGSQGDRLENILR